MRTRKGRQYTNPSLMSGDDNPYLRQKGQSASLSTVMTKNWSLVQNQAYVQFISDHEKRMKDQTLRRSSKIFLQMSYFIGTKTPEQCRTHHQKVLARYQKLQKIMGEYLIEQERRKKTNPQGNKIKSILDTSNFAILKEQDRNFFTIRLFCIEFTEY